MNRLIIIFIFLLIFSSFTHKLSGVQSPYLKSIGRYKNIPHYIKGKITYKNK